MRITQAIKQELENIITEEGKLTPQNVRAMALKRDTALHAYFVEEGAFDKEKAMEQYQLSIARQLIIRVTVTVLDNKNEPTRVRAYTSLQADRHTGGGYRTVVSVLEDKELRAQMLATAMMELAAFQRKYQQLIELRPIMREIERMLPARKKESKQQEARARA